jgi:hypothetical protein
MSAILRESLSKSVIRLNSNRQAFFDRVWEGTRDAYFNTEENVWFKDAVKERVLYCAHITQVYVDDELAGYIGYDGYGIPTVGRVAYVEIATCFPDFQRNGVVQRLLTALQDEYDGVMLRTQNPNMFGAMYQAYGSVEPFEGVPSEEAKRCAAIIGNKTPKIYDFMSMVSKGIYDGKCLTGKVIEGNKFFTEQLYSRINPSQGDAIILVSLFGKSRTYSGRVF